MLGETLPGRTDLAPVAAFDPGALHVLVSMLSRRVRAPWTSSMGRLFDAVASIAGLCQQSRFEAQAAMALEFAAEAAGAERGYPIGLRERESGPLVVDWEPMVRALLTDLRDGVSGGVIAARFHEGLADAAVRVAKRSGLPDVALSGGCFQNRVLAERIGSRLEEEGFRVHRHKRVPPNDGGVALGQIAWAHLRTREADSGAPPEAGAGSHGEDDGEERA
jgi:hydrogenase maturation protein HypF